MNESEGTSEIDGACRCMFLLPHEHGDEAVYNWLADEGMLDWITVEVDHG